jgi:integrase
MENKNESKKSVRDYGIIQKKDKNGNVFWYARIVRIEGNGKKKQYTQKAESKTHARRLRDELSAKFNHRGEKAIEGDKMLFRELCDIYLDKKLFAAEYHGEGKTRRKVSGVRSLKPVQFYLGILRDYFGAKLIRNITHSDIEQFKTKRLKVPTLRGERSIADVNRTLALLRTMFRFAVQSSWLSDSPFDKGGALISLSDENKRERVLSYQEETCLLAACTDKREHLKTILITALDTAMRSGEILKLCWRDIDFANKTINILGFNTKTAKARTVGMTQRVYDELSRLWEQSPKDLDELVFGIKDTVKRSFASACRIAEIDGFRFHDCRHTAITRMIQAGLSPMEVMKVSGHTQMNTFARYVNPNTQAVTRIADVLSAYNNQPTNEVTDFVN